MSSVRLSARSTRWEVFPMSSYKIRQIFEHSYDGYSAQNDYQSDVQRKAAHAIVNCKSGKLGVNWINEVPKLLIPPTFMWYSRFPIS